MPEETEEFILISKAKLLTMLKKAVEKSIGRELAAFGRNEEKFCYCGIFPDGQVITITDVMHSIGPDDVRVFFSIGKERHFAIFVDNEFKEVMPTKLRSQKKK